MDVPVFVGFAASGPLHQPVVVEDVAEFGNVFGERLALAWDAQRGEQSYAHLAPAVRAFFRNGGRRCWVIRVASERARANRFVIPGLSEVTPAGDFASAEAEARSEGSWSDDLRVGAALDSRPAPAERLSLAPDGSVQVELGVPSVVAVGDLLRLTFTQDGYILLFAVEVVRRPAPEASSLLGSPLNGAAPTTAQGRALWFRSQPPAGGAPGVVGSPIESLFGSPLGSPSEPIDDLLQLALEPLSEQPVPLPVGHYAERLTFELWVRQADGALIRLRDLGFVPGHPRYWRDLPTDAQLYGTTDRFGALGPVLTEGPWADAINPRFSLSGGGPAPVPLASALPEPPEGPRPLFLPLSYQDDGTLAFMPTVLDLAGLRGPDPSLDGASALDRDGLATFDENLFLEPRLAAAGLNTVLAEADFLRYEQRATTRRLRGIYAALEVAHEASLIAVPDAVHRGWSPEPDQDRLPPPEPAVPPAPPVDCCDPPHAEPGPGQFEVCNGRPAPVFNPIADKVGGSYLVSWTPMDAEGVRYVLEEAMRGDLADATVVYRGPERQFHVEDRADGVYFYRVRAEVGTEPAVERGPFSAAIGVRVRFPHPALLAPLDGADAADAVLLRVQRALLTLCAAHAELLAVLDLPASYGEDRALAHTQRLAQQVGGDTRTLSFGALYHPWLIGRDERSGELGADPPSGAICGLIARRSVDRGAWVAPANEALRAVLALSPALAEARRLDLQEGAVNVIRQEPRGVMPLCASTLSPDPELSPINVRRLLMLLRRLALRRGNTYVFEPNDPAFRRSVQRGFEGLLDVLFTRGAFAGPTPDGAYRVDTSPTVNPPASVDAGRFVVELRVAPSQPLTFLTIRLVQSQDRALAVVEV